MHDRARDQYESEKAIERAKDAPAHVLEVGGRFIEHWFSEEELRRQDERYLAAVIESQREFQRKQMQEAWEDSNVHRADRAWRWFVHLVVPLAFEEACGAVAIIRALEPNAISASTLPSPFRALPPDWASNYLLNTGRGIVARASRIAWDKIETTMARQQEDLGVLDECLVLVRSRPDIARAAREFIEDRFSERAVVAWERQERLLAMPKEQRHRVEGGEWAWPIDPPTKASPATRIEALWSGYHAQGRGMSSAWASTVIVVAGWTREPEPATNPALPELLREETFDVRFVEDERQREAIVRVARLALSVLVSVPALPPIRRKRNQAPTPKDWIYLDAAQVKYQLRPATSHKYANQLPPGNRKKDENSGKVLVNEAALRAFLKQKGLPVP